MQQDERDRGMPARSRRPASWLGEAEIRRRARRRNLLYLMVAACCMVLFVVLIHLLLEKTRGSAGASSQNAVSAVSVNVGVDASR